MLFSFCEFSLAEEQHQVNVAFAHDNGFSYWDLLGRLLITWTNGYLRGEESCLDEFQEFLSAYRASGALIGLPWFLNLYAELLWRFGKTREALVVLGESEDITSLTKERFFLVDTLRLKGDLHATLSADPASAVAAQCFREAIHLSRLQGSWLPGMRAAIRLARVLQRLGEVDEAKALITYHYKQLSWIQCPDYEEARALINELSLHL